MLNNKRYDATITISRKSTNGSDVSYHIYGDAIQYLRVSESIFSTVPTLSLKFIDVNLILDDRPVTDGDTLIVTMGTNGRSDDVKSLEFAISSISSEGIGTTKNKSNMVVVSGYMFIDGLLSINSLGAIRGSSDYVLGEVARSMGITFDSRASGEESTVWYNVGTPLSFIQHVADRSYINEDGVFVYCGVDGAMVYTSFKTEISNEPKWLMTHDDDRVLLEKLSEKTESNIVYYDDFKVVDSSHILNNKSNYNDTLIYYDLEDMVIDKCSVSSKNTEYANMDKDYVDSATSSLTVMGPIGDFSYRDTLYRGRLWNSYYKYLLSTVTVLFNISNVHDVKLFDVIDVRVKATIAPGYSSPYSGKYVILSISRSFLFKGVYNKRILVGRYGVNEGSVPIEGVV